MRNLQKVLIVIVIGTLVSCGSEQSSITGWNFNDTRNGGFEKTPFMEQETGPNLVLIEGGTFTMGRVVDDVQY